jgi:hypothetical protein
LQEGRPSLKRHFYAEKVRKSHKEAFKTERVTSSVDPLGHLPHNTAKKRAKTITSLSSKEQTLINLGFDSPNITLQLSLNKDPNENSKSPLTARYQIWPESRISSAKSSREYNDKLNRFLKSSTRESLASQNRPSTSRPSSPLPKDAFKTERRSTNRPFSKKASENAIFDIKGQNLLDPFAMRKRSLLRQSRGHPAKESSAYLNRPVSAFCHSTLPAEEVGKYFSVIQK